MPHKICSDILSTFILSEQLMDLSPSTLKTFLRASLQCENRPEIETLDAVVAWMGHRFCRTIIQIFMIPVNEVNYFT